MKNKTTFVKWIQKHEAFLPSDAINPPAIVVRAEDPDLQLLNTLKNDLDFIDKQLDTLKLLTSVDSNVWRILDVKPHDNRGLFSQEQLEAFIERMKFHNKSIIDNMNQIYKDLKAPVEPKDVTLDKFGAFMHQQNYAYLLSSTKTLKDILKDLKPDLKNIDSTYLAELVDEINDFNFDLRKGGWDMMSNSVLRSAERKSEEARKAMWDRLVKKHEKDYKGIGRHFKGEMPADFGLQKDD